MLTDYDLRRFRYCTGRTIDSMLYIESLPDAELLDDLRDRFSPDTNPRWIASQQARVLYLRERIGDKEYDILSERADYMSTDRWLMLARLLSR